MNNISINYDECKIDIEDLFNRERTLLCSAFRSIEYIGQYDENVIKDINVIDKSDLINRTAAVIEKCNRCKDENLVELNVELIDSVSIKIICQKIIIF